MSDKMTVGRGASMEGKRWFLSGCGDKRITVKAGQISRDSAGISFEQPGEYIDFQRNHKPDMFVGGGKMGNMNPSGMDLNRNRIYGVVMADGDTPEGRKVIEFLRKHHSYLHVQNNILFDVDKLKMIELDWDPTDPNNVGPTGSWVAGGAVQRPDISIKKGDFSGLQPPAEPQRETQTASVATMSRKIAKPGN